MSELPHPEVVILNAALELQPPERAGYLDNACAGDAALRVRVEALLKAHEQAEDFLESPHAGFEFKRTARPAVFLTEKPGDKIGRYKLLQQIGEGGCGVVYMAEQEEPVRRRVALKVIKLGMDTKSVIARFEAERQALALMDHPNIARVLDAGATETGRPYFVMELVRGIKITDYCDENKVSTEMRLKLFIQVCQAIQHAHQKGVIHRDIKPSNILVTVNDGVPVPKVIDFGIAKATQGRLTDKTLFTAFEQFIGTPAYMSPEQAVMTSLDSDTRSDIYSLGVLLYELLTGKTPFDQKELLATGLDEMRRTIREKEPPKPSTRLTQELVSKSEIGNRKSEIEKAIHLIRGDLDWIVMKCLEKDRARRYETANGLASDIQRHLNCEPVIARPPSKFYEFQKTVRRHKFGFVATGAVMVALLLGLGMTIWSLAKERQARQRAVAAETKALDEAVQTRQQTRLLQGIIQSLVPAVILGAGRDTLIMDAELRTTAASLLQLTNQPGFSRGNGDAQFLIGFLYLRGDGVPKNPAEAQRWFVQAANLHNLWAGNQLGMMYEHGDSVPKDAALAAQWFLKGAMDGNHGAQIEQVRIYKTGEGVAKNEAEGLKWQRVIMDKADSQAWNDLAWQMATYPDVQVRDGKSAVTLAEKAVAATYRGNANNLDTLAAAYAETGDFEKAVSVQKEAIKFNQVAAFTKEMESRLMLYESNTPYRQPLTDDNAHAAANSSTNNAAH